MAARTAKQKAALKKAQAASARKRRGRRRRIAGVAAGVAIAGGVAYAAHKKGYRVTASHAKSSKKGKRVSAHRSSQHVAVRGRLRGHHAAVGILRPKKRRVKTKVKGLTHSAVYGAYAKQKR